MKFDVLRVPRRNSELEGVKDASINIIIDQGKHTMLVPSGMAKIVEKMLRLVGFYQKNDYRVSLGAKIRGSARADTIKVIKMQTSGVVVNILPGDNGTNFKVIFPIPREYDHSVFFNALRFAAAFLCATYDFRADRPKTNPQKINEDFLRRFLPRNEVRKNNSIEEKNNILINSLQSLLDNMEKEKLFFSDDVWKNFFWAGIEISDKEKFLDNPKPDSEKLAYKFLDNSGKSLLGDIEEDKDYMKEEDDKREIEENALSEYAEKMVADLLKAEEEDRLINEEIEAAVISLAEEGKKREELLKEISEIDANIEKEKALLMERQKEQEIILEKIKTLHEEINAFDKKHNREKLLSLKGEINSLIESYGFSDAEKELLFKSLAEEV